MLVERLSPEEYLLGLGEMPYSWHPAALRAQAIAARTYLANLLANPPWGVMAEFGFDICGSAVCQLYLGAGRAQVAEDGSRWAAAVSATAGKILLYDGTPALAVYHSTAGATTRSNQDVWGGAARPLPAGGGGARPGLALRRLVLRPAPRPVPRHPGRGRHHLPRRGDAASPPW